MSPRLGVNIDHVATLRNARQGFTPDPLRAARDVAKAGAEGVTVHLREDRRHIRDEDVVRLVKEGPLPVNLEMAPTAEMVAMACALRPYACCLVPERREELTTEGGLEVVGARDVLRGIVSQLGAVGIRVSLFVDPDLPQIEAAHAIGAEVVELHTGAYCENRAVEELERLRVAAAQASALGLEVHAGHGLTFETVKVVAAIEQITELNIGHFIVSEAVFVGLGAAVTRMRGIIKAAR